jgi:catechol 2,3-dioxygenase-like lactoylglutathione lyase family enzyme
LPINPDGTLTALIGGCRDRREYVAAVFFRSSEIGYRRGMDGLAGRLSEQEMYMTRFARAVLPAVAIGFLLGGTAEAQPTSAPAPAAVHGHDALIGAALYVSDLQRSLKYYRDTLGMRVMMQFNPPGAQDKSRPDTVLSFGGGPADPMLMLLSDRNATGARKIEHGFGFSRVVLTMADLEGVNARLRASGFAPGTIHDAHGTLKVMMLTDPDGYTVEVIQR